MTSISAQCDDIMMKKLSEANVCLVTNVPYKK